MAFLVIGNDHPQLALWFRAALSACTLLPRGVPNEPGVWWQRGENLADLSSYSYIESDTDQDGLIIKVSSDDSSKIYLNGTQIYRFAFGAFFESDRHTVRGVKLKAGRNVLVFKVVNTINDWRGSIRFTDSAGNPVPGIRVTLDPGKEDNA